MLSHIQEHAFLSSADFENCCFSSTQNRREPLNPDKFLLIPKLCRGQSFHVLYSLRMVVQYPQV